MLLIPFLVVVFGLVATIVGTVLVLRIGRRGDWKALALSKLGIVNDRSGHVSGNPTAGDRDGLS